MQYKQFISYNINPDTGVSEVFNKGFYSERGTTFYRNNLPQITKNNRVLYELLVDIMSLVAYGLNHSDTIKILSLWNDDLSNLGRGVYKDYITKCCIYYSYHISELHKLIKDYSIRAEELIDFYVANKDNPKINKFENSPINLDTCKHDIRSLINRLLNIANIEIPEEHKISELDKQINELKLKFCKCEKTELINEYYGELISLMTTKEEQERINNSEEYDSYEAVRYLRSCGFIEAAYKWLSYFPENR